MQDAAAGREQEMGLDGAGVVGGAQVYFEHVTNELKEGTEKSKMTPGF